MTSLALAASVAAGPLAAVSGATFAASSFPGPAHAADGAAIGKCLLKSCQVPLAKCVTNPGCLANLACIQSCNGKADESACQIRCGDVFDNPVIAEFNDCAVSQKKCVPQRENDNSYPPPPEGSLVTKFDTASFTGRWYISAGLNQIFDTFPCQVHFFESPGPGKLYGKLNWRVLEPDGEFLERNAVQRFVQDPKEPGILYNHDNEYLHYQDDWYILDQSEAKGEEFILVYYRGRNDAWDGYGGAVLYTKAPDVPEAAVPRIRAAAKKGGLDFDAFLRNDNSCKAQADADEALKLREAYASRQLAIGERNLQERLTAERNLISSTVVAEEKELSSEAKTALGKLEARLEAYEQSLERAVEKEVKAVEDEVEAVEEEIVKDARSIFGRKK